MRFANVPITISYKDLVSHRTNSLSSSDYLTIQVNSKFEYLKDLITTPIYGKEVGGFNYMESSKFKFIRTKCLQATSILLNLDEAIGINPKNFRNFNLQKHDILLVKDSNIGEVCYIHEDLPHYTISSGVVKLNINDKLDKFYVIGIMKSSFFKEQIDLMTPKGATIRHSKDNFKYAKIPVSKNTTIIDKISVLTQSLINKEIELKNKFYQINSLIEQELQDNQLANTFNYQMPSFTDLSIHNRLDTGLYTKEFKQIEFLILNYKNGYYYLDEKDLKSGATPKENDRIFNSGNINWITPTNINDYGAMYKIPKIAIRSKKYNISKNCILFINRTSKGNKGEYVGISHFYNYDIFGKGQHNQGLYRLENKSKTELLFLTSFMNSKFARKLCSNISMGSKMKEMKSLDFEKLPIPKFPKNKQIEIAKLYYNPSDDSLEHIINFDINFFDTIDLEVTKKSGILDLDQQIKNIKSIIDNQIKNMVK
jgi:type I restriction enzyme S subunit